MNRIIFRLLLLLISILLLYGCERDHNLKTSIQSYKGAGQIRYLEAPGLLGSSGCEIRLPDIDLSRNQAATYKLSGIPVGKEYFVKLVLPDGSLKEVLDGEFSYQIILNNKILRDNKSSIRKMMHTGIDSVSNNVFYYWNSEQIATTYFDVDNETGNYSISINYKNIPSNQQIPGYVLISRGGFK